MIRAVLNALALTCLCFPVAAQDFDAGKIDPALLHHASFVVRKDDTRFEVKSPGSAVQTCTYAVTVLNKNGDPAAAFTEYYDRSSSISNIRATLYDAQGKKVRDYRSSELIDQSAISSYSLYEDYRVKHLEMNNQAYPYTLEYSYTKDYNGLLNYPAWRPLAGFGYAVEHSTYELIIPEGLNVRMHKSRDLATDSIAKERKIRYRWSAKNLSAFEPEPLSAGLESVTPWVQISPNHFVYDKAEGRLNNWQDLGKWIFDLSNGGDQLSAEKAVLVRELVKKAGSAQEKISILYNYLQQSTRYVSVQLGIGGFKPIAAEKVSQVSYGDCKALSNYMKAMLKEAGIASNLVVIGAGLPSLKRDFASFNQANHMILSVPLGKDTTWLECTSQQQPAGYVAHGIADRTVLLVTEKGGILARTPALNPEKNFQRRQATVTLLEDGNAQIKVNTTFGAAQYEDNMELLSSEPSEQRKYLLSRYAAINPELESYAFKQPDRARPEMQEDLAIKAIKVLTSGGDRSFLTLNLLNRREAILPAIEARKTPFALPFGYQDDDELTFVLPAGYKVEFLPKPVTLESEFGKYEASVTQQDGKILYKRRLRIQDKTFAPGKYNDLVEFYKKIYQADKVKAVLAKSA
ncbi:hypothetical protein C7T94_15055 [Pedobacter yulinensis]|uniref:DUF3857 domain-containing protein n=1 Tax=Pedobacter yulinensis TaxID=2126353 RepID=A0A2T3HIB0_9SPHI|nr:DUF3857 domain-containing protein [Pedobacter yulinensis]PST82121.1 hypothetical protein C7T94_15055 [Pedobacter yulinensis]